MKCTKHIKQEHFLKIDGKKITMARIDIGWTITQLSERSGVTRKTIGEIEKEKKRKIRFSTINQIALTMGKQVDDFCTQIEKDEEGNFSEA